MSHTRACTIRRRTLLETGTMQARVCSLVLLYLCISLVIATDHYATQEPQCCGEKLQDHMGRVVLDAGVQITESPFYANRIMTKFCIRAPVVIQLWKQLDPANNVYQLRKQWLYTPHSTMPLNEWIQIEIDGISIEPVDRIGLQANSDDTYKLPIQFDYTQDHSRSVVMAESQSLAGTLQLGTSHTFDLEYQMPWSYFYYVRFCHASAEDGVQPTTPVCNVDIDAPLFVMLTGAQGPPGPPGPPGECGFPDWSSDQTGSGTEGSGTNGGSFTPTCSADIILQDQLNSLSDTTIILQNTLDKFIGESVGTNLIAGDCPDYWVPGSYGIGSCYFFSFGNTFDQEALDTYYAGIPATSNPYASFGSSGSMRMQFNSYAIWCWENFGALPLKIDTKSEENFIVSTMLNRMSLNPNSEGYMEIGTGGMLNVASDVWTWFEHVYHSLPASMEYQNWGSGEPMPQRTQSCMKVRAYGNQQYYWISAECRSQTLFACEKRKACY